MKHRLKHISQFFLKAILFLVASLAIVNGIAQEKVCKNLIPNPSFETRKSKSNDIKAAIPWKGVGTVDYYLKPDKRDTSRFKGARTGVNYAGLRFQSDYKEYMSAKLLETLKKGETYHFKMYIRILEANNVTVAVKQLGAYFSEMDFKVGMTFEEDGLVDTTYNKGIAGTLDWMLIQGDYTAKGNEKYIIIGNFRTKMKDDFVKKNKWALFEFKEAYYYIDDISLCKKNEKTEVAKNDDHAAVNNWMPISFETGQTFEIENLYFEKETSILLSTSNNSLDELADALKNEPKMTIQINGHIDKFGNEAEEKRISQERAKAVYDYLKNKGVSNPMVYKGFGATQSVAPNNSDEFKAKNRRVTISIINK